MSLLVNYLEKVQESEKLTGTIKEVISILLVAINDWPTPIISLGDYEKDVYKLIGEEVSRKTMKESISNIDNSKNAWEGESLSQLIEIFNYYEEEKQLKEILKDIQGKIEN
ncbi:hypothetical protein [Flavobacterium sp. HSC-61S13]|uniref:hypothetical protein n=1 Tax=Flavobacterium sp. HSC-61S13 TaxID=2910963 RepID=UPI0020A1CEFB|nr:hypothetical protein [Flavobacterium sp. HSC-61S13]MCP1995521.1 hypothetical protein [Flavobacterium sp. HSC-61S13]